MGHYKNKQIAAQEIDQGDVKHVDDLDLADSILGQIENNIAPDEAMLATQRAIAHIQLWYAKEARAYKEAVEAQRRVFQQAQAAAPPPPLPFPPFSVPQGF